MVCIPGSSIVTAETLSDDIPLQSLQVQGSQSNCIPSSGGTYPCHVVKRRYRFANGTRSSWSESEAIVVAGWCRKTWNRSCEETMEKRWWWLGDKERERTEAEEARCLDVPVRTLIPIMCGRTGALQSPNFHPNRLQLRRIEQDRTPASATNLEARPQSPRTLRRGHQARMRRVPRPPCARRGRPPRTSHWHPTQLQSALLVRVRGYTASHQVLGRKIQGCSAYPASPRRPRSSVFPALALVQLHCGMYPVPAAKDGGRCGF